MLLSPQKLMVTLRPTDLAELGISYESLDYADPLTRGILVTLLEQGKEETGFRPRNAKLFIEVFPTEEGGCVLHFTCLGPGRLSGPGSAESLAPSAVVFAFQDADELIDAAVKVFARYSHRIFKSSLYLLGGSYRLVVYPLDYADDLSILFLSEFAPKTGEGQVLAEFIDEHGALLIADTALDTLAGYFA